MDKKASTTLSKVLTKMVVLLAALILMTTSNAQAAGPSWAFGFNRREFFQLIAPGDRGNASGLDLDFGLPEPEPVYIPPSHNEERVIEPVPAPRRRPQPAPEEEEEEAPPASNPAPAPPPAPCTPRYAQPSLTFTTVDPPFPIPQGQDPEEEGFDVTITARGGQKTNACNRGPNRASLTALSVQSINLSSSTIAWIEEELSQSYPEAHVLGQYPLSPNGNVNLNGTTGTLSFHVDSLDPGDYVVTAEARQNRGNQRSNSETFTVQVSLMEGTIWGGGGK